MSRLSASVTGVGDIIAIDVSGGHSVSTSTGNVLCKTLSLDIGDSALVQIGYDGNPQTVLNGYVKSIERNVPDNLYSVTISDVMVRAIDYFVVSSNPENPFTRQDISAEDLIEDVMELAGLTSFNLGASQFTFATLESTKVEVNLVSSYDFCKMIADLLAWNIWADEFGTIHFKNRKPYVMDGLSGQPGDTIADGMVSTVWTKDTLNIEYRESDQDLRNRVVVYGTEGVYAEASESSPYLPSGFYKSMALATSIIDKTSNAQKACNYNLALYNRLTKQCSVTTIGDPVLLPRRCITLKNNILGIDSDWYIYMAQHSWTREGYTTSLELRQ